MPALPAQQWERNSSLLQPVSVATSGRKQPLAPPRERDATIGPPVPLAGLFDAVGSVTNQCMAVYEMGPWATAVGGHPTYFDSVTAVPEPSTAVLLLLAGLIAAAYYKRGTAI